MIGMNTKSGQDWIHEFETHRAHLFGIAYRMLGSVADAEDMVQETFLRWRRPASQNIESPKAWLSTVMTRLCLNYLNSARVRREEYVGAWLPEPLVEEQVTSPSENAKLADSLSLAFLVLLESLSPTERAVFLLREVFGYEFADIAPIVEKNEENCRQIFSRARRRVEENRPRFDASPGQAEAVVERFLRASESGDLNDLLALLTEDARVVADGGGRVGTARRPIEGAERVARWLVSEFRKHAGHFTRSRRVTINGQPGVLCYSGPLLMGALAYGVRDGRIASIHIVANPEKLRRLMSPPARLLARVLFALHRRRP